MRPFTRFTFLLSLLTVPAVALAAQETVWDFTNGKDPGEWHATPGMEVTATSQGLLLHATKESALYGNVADHPVDALSMDVQSGGPMDIMLLWRWPGMEKGFHQLPVRLTGGTQHIPLGVSSFPQWSRRPEAVGIALPQGSSILLLRLTAQGFSLPTRLTEAWRSFWTFDVFSSYSVNFLWGPLVTFDPVSRTQLFERQPPMAQSANRYFYLAIILAGLILFGLRRLRGYRNALPLFLGIVAVLWVFYDVRMGTEYLSYALTDYRSYISQPEQRRLFRQYQNFARSADQAVPLLQRETSYTVIPPAQTQVQEILQYMTYPVIPARTDEEKLKSRLWFIFRRPDVSINSNGQLVAGGQAMTRPGHIIQRYDGTSFLFRVNE